MVTLTIQIDERVQTEAAAVLNAQGLSVSDVVLMTLRQIAAEKRLPTALSLPAEQSAEETAPSPSADDLTGLPAFGRWADREEMDNPAKWIQNLRPGRYRDF
ncbi:MAG: type II toxin-antitoxin system RelB/DinJ family antitoxin [Deltaproteobacteria bacterium]|jgi:addiction module RelB/DinJ family antitoxin|nr:type II toxin-antitoxin system RelB/DinJ family antitoxin [Deltaproteobacteria bacterium]